MFEKMGGVHLEKYESQLQSKLNILFLCLLRQSETKL